MITFTHLHRHLDDGRHVKVVRFSNDDYRLRVFHPDSFEIEMEHQFTEDGPAFKEAERIIAANCANP